MFVFSSFACFCIVHFFVSFFIFFFFFFNDTATTEIYTLSLHDALPILGRLQRQLLVHRVGSEALGHGHEFRVAARSEEHTSELQSLRHLVCRLLLEKKKKKKIQVHNHKENNNRRQLLVTTRNNDMQHQK